MNLRAAVLIFIEKRGCTYTALRCEYNFKIYYCLSTCTRVLLANSRLHGSTTLATVIVYRPMLSLQIADGHLGRVANQMSTDDLNGLVATCIRVCVLNACGSTLDE